MIFREPLARLLKKDKKKTIKKQKEKNKIRINKIKTRKRKSNFAKTIVPVGEEKKKVRKGE